MKEGITIVVTSATILFAILFWNDITGLFGNNKSGEKKETIKEKKSKEKGFEKDSEETAPDGTIKILEKWEMPEILTEVSGISHLDQNKIACIQDEMGTVFIYNTETKAIEKEIKFSGAGDFEDVAVAGQNMYVIRADGRLFEISNYANPKPTMKEFTTGLTIENDVESLCYDPKGNRLLLTGKEADAGNSANKQILVFDLKTKSMAKEPLLTIDLHQEQQVKKKSKKASDLKPSAINIHPKSGNIYFTDGPSVKMVIFDVTGKIKATHNLDKSVFPQPEGISFSPAGEVFISTEGKKEPGAIVKVEVMDPV